MSEPSPRGEVATDEQFFWARANIGEDDECWNWTGPRRGKGYGSVRWNGRTTNAHRVAWLIANGPIPKGNGYHGTCVLHRCDNRLCVNPAHLYLGTPSDNMRDRKAAGRYAPEFCNPHNALKTHCPQGHPYNEENTRWDRNKRGRHCRKCHAMRRN